MDANGGRYDAFPADQAIAYIIEILPAFSYLHSQGLLYCDFKPDNVIQAGDTIKLIDLGGVRRVDDDRSRDLRHRRLPGARGRRGRAERRERHLHDRPDARGARDGVPRLPVDVRREPAARRRHAAVPALRLAVPRARRRPRRPNPDDRFQSRRRAARPAPRCPPRGRRGRHGRSRRPRIRTRRRCSARRPAPAPDLAWTRPARCCAIDRADPSATWLAGVSVADGAQRLEVLEQAPAADRRGAAREGPRRDRRRHFPVADQVVNDVLTDNPWEWRAVWLSGLAALARCDFEAAATAFNTVLGQVPGELAPKLALALACEETGADDLAEQLYAVCAATDANYVAPAAFGSRATRAQNRGDVAGSLDALDLVAPTSGAYVAARRRRADLLTEPAPGLDELRAAAASVENITIDARPTGLARRRDPHGGDRRGVRTDGDEPATMIGGVAATEIDLRARPPSTPTATSRRSRPSSASASALVDDGERRPTPDARVSACPACGAPVAADRPSSASRAARRLRTPDRSPSERRAAPSKRAGDPRPAPAPIHRPASPPAAGVRRCSLRRRDRRRRLVHGLRDPRGRTSATTTPSRSAPNVAAVCDRGLVHPRERGRGRARGLGRTASCSSCATA